MRFLCVSCYNSVCMCLLHISKEESYIILSVFQDGSEFLWLCGAIRCVVKGSLAPTFFCCLNRLLYNCLIEGCVILYIDFLLSQWTVFFSEFNTFNIETTREDKMSTKDRKNIERFQKRSFNILCTSNNMPNDIFMSYVQCQWVEDVNDDIENISLILYIEGKIKKMGWTGDDRIKYIWWDIIRSNIETYLYVMCALHLKCHSFYVYLCRKCQAYTF